MRLPADQRRSQLLEVARDKFADQGFHATSMDEIAEAAGVTKPVLYQHFPSKRALYVELLESTGAEMLTTLAEVTGRAGSARERVEMGFRAYFEFALGNRSAFRLLLSSAIRSDPEFARIVEEIIDATAETISLLINIEGSQDQRLVLASALVGMGESVGRWALQRPEGAVDAGELAHWISELVWFGLRGIRTDAIAADPAFGSD
jgi:AcrR family transcriptional regulator